MEYREFKAKGGTIINEECFCGALRTEHADTTAQGHGGCESTGCKKFTWKGFVYKSEETAAKN